MFIQTEATPNPNSLKFIPDNIQIAKDNPCEFKSKQEAENSSELAKDLFLIEGVKSVFLGSNFITINKADEKEWDEIKTEILATITDFLVCEKPIFYKNDQKDTDIEDSDSDVVKQIKELIEMKVRPAVAMDGGDIIYVGFEDGIVSLQLKGSCSGCPSSEVTLKNGIENMLKHYIPEVEAVEAVKSDDY
ncbi:MAG: NifU family protein [Proteobacteria bacterium]|nr:NifU family protein [Pseudomonadota bacterium]